MYYMVPDYKLYSSNEFIAERRIMQLAYLDALVSTVHTCLQQPEKRDVHRRKVYANIFTSYVNEAGSHLSGEVSSFVQFWELEELVFTSEITVSDLKEDQ